MKNLRYKTILLFGAPGSGKGTQGKILGAIPGFFHSSTGDIFRSLDLQSPTGRTVWEYVSKGKLVPDQLTINIWKQYLQGMELINQFHPETEIIVLDGGEVVDRGTHEELMEGCGFYREIAEHGLADSVFLQADLEDREEMARL